MHEWRVIGLNYLLHDQQTLRSNIVESIDWSVSKEESGFTAERHGTIELRAPGDVFVAFQDITEAQALEWAKDAIGRTLVESLEAQINSELSLLITPTHGSGVPWTDGGI